MNAIVKKLELQLEDFYKSEKLLNVPLQDNCKYCAKCWNGIEIKKRQLDNLKETSKAHIYKPYIGEKFNEFGLLILGLNMNNHGGYEEQKNIAEEACRLLCEGKKKLNFDNEDYSGSIYWHRIASYAIVYLENAKIMDVKWDDNGPDYESFEEAFDYFAITNSIKCAPKNLSKGDRSQPTNEMINNCPSYILKKEIEILKPKRILILGKENFTRIVHELSNEISIEIERDGDISKIQINGMSIIGIIHPTAFGGSKSKLFWDLEEYAE